MDILLTGTEYSGIEEVADWLSTCTNVRGVREYRPLDAAFAAWDEFSKWEGNEEERGKLEFALTRYMLDCYVRDERTLFDTHVLSPGRGYKFLKFVKRFFPETKIVVMVRNGEHVVRDMHCHPHSKGKVNNRNRLRPIRECAKTWNDSVDAIFQFLPEDVETKLFHTEDITAEQLSSFLEVSGGDTLSLSLEEQDLLSREKERILESELKFNQKLLGYA